MFAYCYHSLAAAAAVDDNALLNLFTSLAIIASVSLSVLSLSLII